MSEYRTALELAVRILDKPGLDPDEDICVLARSLVRLSGHMQISRQAHIEFLHAWEVGPSWYTKGESGLRQQVRHWLDKGLEATSGFEPSPGPADWVPAGVLQRQLAEARATIAKLTADRASAEAGFNQLMGP